MRAEGVLSFVDLLSFLFWVKTSSRVLFFHRVGFPGQVEVGPFFHSLDDSSLASGSADSLLFLRAEDLFSEGSFV